MEDKRDYMIVEAAFANMKHMFIERKLDLIPVPQILASDADLQRDARILFTMKNAMGVSQLLT